MAEDEDSWRRGLLIAAIVGRFAMLEYYVRKTLASLLSADPVAAHVLTVGPAARAGAMISTSLAILKESERKGVDRGSPELHAALVAASNAFKRRNDLLHNITMLYEEDGKDIAEVWKRTRGQDLPTRIPVQIEDLESIEDEANAAINALAENQPRPPFMMPKAY